MNVESISSSHVLAITHYLCGPVTCICVGSTPQTNKSSILYLVQAEKELFVTVTE